MWWIMVVGIFILSTRYFFSHTALFDTISSYVMYPILVVQKNVVTPIKYYFSKKKTLRECYEVITCLRAERDELLAQNVQLHAMISYEQDIQELIMFKKQYQEAQGIVAQVLVKHFSDHSHYYLIDKGSNAGIKSDMVAVYKNCLLGKIVEVFPQYSKVLLITDRLCKVAAYCPHTKATGIHEGNNQENISGLKYVSHLAQVEPDDLVLSSGDGLVFPRGFALGKIKKCNPEGLFYDVSVDIVCDLRAIQYCFIVQKGSCNLVPSDTSLMELADSFKKTFNAIFDEEEHDATPISVTAPLNDKNVGLCHAVYIHPQELLQQQRLVGALLVDDTDKGVLQE